MWARIENSRVAEITGIDPAGRFHESLIWLACADDVVPGWRMEGGELIAPEEPGGEDQQTAERNWRTTELASTEWLVMRHRDELDMGRSTTLTDEQYAELLTYRQALRDWPLAAGFPDTSQRPVAPDWLAEQTE